LHDREQGDALRDVGAVAIPKGNPAKNNYEINSIFTMREGSAIINTFG